MTNDEELLKYKEQILQRATDGEEGFSLYLKSTHINIITDNSICLLVFDDDIVILYYMEAFSRQGYRECREKILSLYNTYTVKQGMPIIYTGKSNVCYRNSIEIKPNLWQFIPS